MFFNFPVEVLYSGYKMVLDFYTDFRVMQHLILFFILIWWFTHPQIKNRVFISGYLSFTFLGLTGAMGHAVEMIGAAGYSVNIYFKLSEIAVFVLFFIILISLIKKKRPLSLLGNRLLWVGLLLIMGVFWYMDKYKCPEGYIFKFFERISFILCISTLVSALQKHNNYSLPRNIWKWWVVIPLFMGLWYPWLASDKLKAFLFSPYGLIPTPTLLVAVSMVALFNERDEKTALIISLAGFYFGLIGWIKLKMVWDIWLVVVSSYTLVLVSLSLCLKREKCVNQNVY